MIIKYDTIKEYIGINLALCGEIDKNVLAPRAPFSLRSIDRAIKALREERVLRKHKYDDGRTFLRLSTVNGLDYLASLSPALKINAEIVVGDNGKYSGTKLLRLRERTCYELYSAMVKENIPINYIEIKQGIPNTEKPASNECEIISNNGTPNPLDKIMADVKLPEKIYLTRRLVKPRLEASSAKDGSRGSRIAGTLILNKQVYQTYSLAKVEGSMWKPDSEHAAASYIAGCIEKAARFKEDNLSIEPKTIIFCQGREEAVKLINGDTRIDPCKIYNQSYVMPEIDISDTMLKLLSVPEWEERIVKVLFPDAEKKGIEDGQLKDGTEIYNFAGANLNKIRYAYTRIHNIDKPVLLLVQAWEKDVIEQIFNQKNVEIAEIEPGDLAILANLITKK